MSNENIVRGSNYLFIGFDDDQHDLLSTAVGGLQQYVRGIRISNDETCMSGNILSLHIEGDPSKCFVTQQSYKTTSLTAIAFADVSSGLVRIGHDADISRGSVLLILLMDNDMPISAMARAGMTATEGIVAAFQDMGMGYNGLCASGSLRQEIVIVRTRDGGAYLRDAGKHSKFGELIGKATIEAVKGAAQMNGVSMASRRTITAALGKHGIDTAKLMDMMGMYDVNEFIQKVGPKNSDTGAFIAIDSVFHICDEVRWGLIPEADGKKVGTDILRCGLCEPVGEGTLEEILVRTVVSYLMGP